MNAQRLLLDGTIRTLPSDIIENILWRLPIEEIVRSSILSKQWRYNWTKIPKVAFTEDFLKNKAYKSFRQRRSEFFSAIYQFLLLHHEPILDFTLSLRNMKSSEQCVYIDQILLHLLRKNSLKKLRLTYGCELPSSIFSFHQLTELYLTECSINHPPTFKAFGSLTTLCLKYIEYIPQKTLMHILSNNPLLRSFTILTNGYSKIVIRNNDKYGTLDELFQCLPVIEHFTLCAWDSESFYSGAVPREVATSLVHLQYLCLKEMCFFVDEWLRFLVLMIKSSPNLEKLKLQMLCEDTEERWKYFSDDLYSLIVQDCSDIWLEHLIELDFEYFSVKKPHLDFVKFILVKSPVLKKVRLKVNDKDEKLEWLEVLLPFQRAFPMVEISIR